MSESAAPAYEHCPRCRGILAVGELGGRCPRCLAAALALSEVASEEALAAPSALPDRLGDYELLEEVGRGGMGVVFRARQVKLDREVALKVIRDSALASTADVDRFRDEAAAAARLAHPHIVRVHDIGEADGRPYFAMEFIAGRHLGELTRHAPLPARQAAELAAKLAEALQHAHDRGVLHRDLKPSNVLVDANGEPHITDFGLAKRFDPVAVGSRGADLTLTGQVLGTPAYMAPEQAGGRRGEAGSATDVYSLGALLYHLITGRAPFTGETITDVLRQVAEQEPLSPRLVNPALPADLATICLKCLAKEPARRYAAAREVAEDLRRFLRSEPIHARPAGRAERTWRWCRRQPALAGALVFAVLAVVAGLIATTWQWRRAEASSLAMQKQAWRARRHESQALRLSGELEQRARLLSSAREESAVAASMELRSSASAALALTDLRELPRWLPGQEALQEALRPPKYAVCRADGTVALWEQLASDHHRLRLHPVGPGQSPFTLDYRTHGGGELLFSPDGRRLVVHYYSGHQVVVWDVPGRRVLWVTNAPPTSDFNFDFSPDGRWLAVCAEPNRVRLFAVEDGHEEPAWELSTDQKLQRARFNPRRPLLAAAAGNELLVWDFSTRRLVCREPFSRGLTTPLAWHPDGERVAVCEWMQPEIHLCRVGHGVAGPGESAPPSALQRRSLQEPGGPTFLLDFSPRGDLLVARGLDGFTRLWDVAAERVLLRTHRGLAHGFSADGLKLYFDRETQGVGGWELVTNGVYHTLRGGGPAEFLGAADFSADGRRLAWGQTGTAALTDLATGTVRARGRDQCFAAWFDRRDDTLLTAGYEGLQRWRDGTPEVLLGGDVFRGLAQTPDGRTLAAITVSNLWLSAPQPRWLKAPAHAELFSVALSPDGGQIALGTHQEKILVLATATGSTEREFTGHRASLAFDPAGRWLAAGTAQEYRLWSTRDWQSLRHWPRESASARHSPLAVSPGGSLLAVTLTPRAIHLLRPDTGEEIARLDAPAPLFISALTFSRDGGQLAASSENGVMQIWNLARLREELRPLGLDWNDPARP